MKRTIVWCACYSRVSANIYRYPALLSTPPLPCPHSYTTISRPQMTYNTTSCKWCGLGVPIPTTDSTSRNTQNPSTVLSEAATAGGWGKGPPDFAMAGPAPYITVTLPLEEFSVGPFVIWIGPEALPRRELFRGMRRHELLRLMGLRLSWIQKLLDAP